MSELVRTHPEIASAIRLYSAWAEYRGAFHDNTGVTVAIVADQQIVWCQGFGYANIEQQEPAGRDTIYRVASITKLFTATAIMQLRDAGKLDLADPIQKHLPWFKINETFPDEPPINILHLLTHTSGLPREPHFDHWLSSSFPNWTSIKSRLPEQNTIMTRATKWKYSNLALALAGAIVSAVSGRDYFEYVETEILRPLGMSASHIRSIPPDTANFATGYGRRLGNGRRTLSPYTDAQGLSAAFNLATTAPDLALFMMLQFRTTDHHVLRARTRQEMHRPHWVNPDWQGGWGIGFEINRVKGETILGHGGAVQGFRTGIRFNIDKKIGAIALTNADDGDPRTYLLKALDIFGPALEAARQEPAATEKLPEAWEAYYGRYRNAWSDEQILAYKGQLIGLDPRAPEPDTFSILEPVGPHTFRMAQKSGFGSHGETVQFVLGADGKAERILGPSGSGEGAVRIEEW